MSGLERALGQRILLLDGGLGTRVQAAAPTEERYRGERFGSWPHPLAGCNEVLVLTAPELVSSIHEAYLAAGADVVTTDSFGANRLTLAEYGLEEYAYELNREAATLARRAADRYAARDAGRPRFVAGSMGPTKFSASLPGGEEGGASRAVAFDDLARAYREQAEGLIDGGADVLLLETVFDTLNAKAALYAIRMLEEERGAEVPVIVSGTVSDRSGRLLSGQTVEAFVVTVAPYAPLALSLNCGLGPEQLLPLVERLSAVAPCRVAAYPNAGLPDESGNYAQTPERFAAAMEEMLRAGAVNMVGGCCGTTPEHIAALRPLVERYAPRPVPASDHALRLSGLEVLDLDRREGITPVGERANVAGSRRFARLVREERWDEAAEVARAEVAAGAAVLDVCMDDGLVDGPRAMTRFLHAALADPRIARVPVMIDSSSWETIVAGLKVVQGRSLVNSLSLREGPERFLERAREVRRLGAAVVVMLFDERGQADSYERKIEVAERVYRLLTADGFPPEGIVFDPNVLAVATGMPEHDRYALDFIRATAWIRAHLPYAHVSGGVSNLSFAFRGHERVRQALHTLFLSHAAQAGMGLAIVNPAQCVDEKMLDPELAALAGDVVLARRADAAQRLAAYATRRDTAEEAPEAVVAPEAWRTEPVAARLRHALLNGEERYAAEDARAALDELGTPLAVIDRMLMPAMGEVGDRFNEGRMFLPQVVRAARVMKRVFDTLAPCMERAGDRPQGAAKVLLATVRGDVHDIGKNIVSVVTQCAGYAVRDLGVMVEAERIVDEAVAWGADVVGLSGLISPSLEEMTAVVRLLQERGLRIPVVVGGATTSDLHTALRMAPLYEGAVIRSRDAADNNRILAQLFGPDRAAFVRRVRAEQQRLRAQHAQAVGRVQLLPLREARSSVRAKGAEQIVPAAQTGRLVFPQIAVQDVEPYIDWNLFFPAWGLKGHFPEVLDDPLRGAEARRLWQDARELLKRIREQELLQVQGVVGLFEAAREGDDIVVTDSRGRTVRLPQLRSQRADGPCRSLADFVAPRSAGTDHIGLFAVTAGVGLAEWTEELRKAGDDYTATLAKLLADRLTAAAAEALHLFVRRRMWGYEAMDAPADPEAVVGGRYQGVRMAFGYPASPDHSLKRETFRLLAVEQTTAMRLTDNAMIVPGEALCGMIFAHPEACYFDVGPVDAEQWSDYARRRGVSEEELRRMIPERNGRCM